MAIHLEPHDPDRAQRYELVAGDVRGALGTMPLLVEHVGSTAIPYILAKPTIDVLVLVDGTSFAAPDASRGSWDELSKWASVVR